MPIEEQVRDSLRRRASSMRANTHEAWPEVERRLALPRPTPVRRVGIVVFALLVSALSLFGVWRGFLERPAQPRPGSSNSFAGLHVAVTVQTGQNTVAVASGGEGVWVVGVDSATCSNVAGRAEQIDTANNQVLRSIPLDFAPTSVTTGLGSVWIGGYLCTPPRGTGDQATFRGIVERLDASSGSIDATIDVGGQEVSGLVVSSGSVWVTWGDPTGSGGAVQEVDPATNTVSRTVMTSGPVRDPTASEGAIWVWELGGDGGSSILRIDTINGSIVRLHVANVAGPPVAGDGSVWIPTSVPLGPGSVLGPNEPAVILVDALTGAVVGSPTPTGGQIFQPFAVGDGSLWFLGGGNGVSTVERLSEKTLTVTDSVRLGDHNALQASLDASGTVWIADQRQGIVVRIDSNNR